MLSLGVIVGCLACYESLVHLGRYPLTALPNSLYRKVTGRHTDDMRIRPMASRKSEGAQYWYKYMFISSIGAPDLGELG